MAPPTETGFSKLFTFANWTSSTISTNSTGLTITQTGTDLTVDTFSGKNSPYSYIEISVEGGAVDLSASIVELLARNDFVVGNNFSIGFSSGPTPNTNWRVWRQPGALRRTELQMIVDPSSSNFTLEDGTYDPSDVRRLRYQWTGTGTDEFVTLRDEPIIIPKTTGIVFSGGDTNDPLNIEWIGKFFERYHDPNLIEETSRQGNDGYQDIPFSFTVNGPSELIIDGASIESPAHTDTSLSTSEPCMVVEGLQWTFNTTSSKTIRALQVTGRFGSQFSDTSSVSNEYIGFTGRNTQLSFTGGDISGSLLTQSANVSIGNEVSIFIKAGETVTVPFEASVGDTLTNLASPVATVYRDGAVEVVSPAPVISNPATGQYFVTFTAPSGWQDYDRIDVGLAATLNAQPVSLIKTAGFVYDLTTGGGATAEATADAVLQELIADHSGVSGSLAEAISNIPTTTEFEARTLPSASYLTSANYGAIATAVWAATTRELTNITAAQITAIATGVEVAIINEGDANQVIDAILQVFNANLDLPALELAAIAQAVRSELAVELGLIDTAISTRLADTDYTAPLNATATETAVTAALTAQGYTSGRSVFLDKLNVAGVLAHSDNASLFQATGFSTHSAADVWAVTTRTLTTIDKTGYSLTPSERTEIATAVEVAIINEGDANQVIDAILQVFNSNLDLPALELQAIATQVRTELTTELARLDVAVSSVALSDTDIRSAVGLTAANLDTQLASKPTLVEMEASNSLTAVADLTAVQTALNDIALDAKAAKNLSAAGL